MIRRHVEWDLYLLNPDAEGVESLSIYEQAQQEQASGPPLVSDFGFTYGEEFIAMTVLYGQRSNWTAWPFRAEDGGLGTWADQPMALHEDVRLWLRLERYERWAAQQRMKGLDPEYEPLPADVTFFRGPAA